MADFSFGFKGGGGGGSAGVREVVNVTLAADGNTAVDTLQSTYKPKALSSVQDASGNEYFGELFASRYYLDGGTYKIDIYNSGNELSNLTIYYV